VPTGSANFSDLDLLSLQECPSFEVATTTSLFDNFPDCSFGKLMQEQQPDGLSLSLPTLGVGLVGSESLPDFPPVPQGEPESEPEDGPAEEGDEQEQRRPDGWDDTVLTMSTPSLNRFIARCGLNKEQGKAIKACRRRLKNRCYAKTSRKRRMDKVAALADDHVSVSARSQALDNEIAQLRRSNKLLQRQLEAFTTLLVTSGKMTRLDIQRYINSDL